MTSEPGPDDLVACSDTETTGLSVEDGDRILAIACVTGTANAGILTRDLWYVDTEGRRSSPESFAVHRIPHNHPDRMPEREALARYDAVAGCPWMVMQNGQFDIAFLKAAYERCGIIMPRRTLIDTMDLSRRLAPGKAANLDAQGARLGLDPAMLNRRKLKHDALEDCEMTFEIWRRSAFPTRLDLDPRAASGRKMVEAPTQATELDW